MPGSSKFTPAEHEIGTADAAKRRKMPAKWFLMPRQRKYPSHDSHGHLSENLLAHAESRATTNGHDHIANAARELRTKHFASDSNGSAGHNGNPGRGGNPDRNSGEVAGAGVGGEAKLGPLEAEAKVGGRIGNGKPVTPSAPKPQEPKAPERKRAHRWI